jgi:ubiquinone/menaquinone biosynthesis C-methylase UbiE
MEATAWERYHVLFWVLIGIGIYIVILILIYLILKYAFKKQLGPLWLYLSYLTCSLPFWPFVEITFSPKKRRIWLQKSGLKQGHVYLEEGFGIGTSPIIASKIVGKDGLVYALDNQPLHIAILFVRSRIRGIKNIKLIFSDSSGTGLEDKSVDTVFICDAFHEFSNKKETVSELYRILKNGGNLAIWDENKKYTDRAQKIIEGEKLFNLTKREKVFIRFTKS